MTTSIAEARINRMVEGWNALRENDYNNDYDKAVFLRDQRRQGCYQRGANGDQAFKHDVNANLLGISGQRALDYIKVLRAYSNRATWRNLGGFKSLYYLQGLNATSRQRSAVMSDAISESDSRGENVTINVVRSCARARGYDSQRGRPSQTQMEMKRDTLARFIFDSFDEVPDNIIEAMPHELAVQFA